jgi:hypothetical protein
MSTPIQIQPLVETITKTATSFTVKICGINLFTSVIIEAELFDKDNNGLGYRTITLSGQDYLNWNNDDQYIINKVAEVLGVSIINK